jgi:hypothetical protein
MMPSPAVALAAKQLWGGPGVAGGREFLKWRHRIPTDRPMTPSHDLHTPNRIDPPVFDLARRRAHELREQAMADARRRLVHWLSRSLRARPLALTQEQPCHS